MDECRYCIHYVCGICENKDSVKFENKTEPDDFCKTFKEGNPYEKGELQ